MSKEPTPIFGAAISGIMPPEGMTEIGAYHGYGTPVGHTNPDTGEVSHNVIIMAGSIDDLREYIAKLIPEHQFDEEKVSRVTLVGTDFVKITDDEL